MRTTAASRAVSSEGSDVGIGVARSAGDEPTRYDLRRQAVLNAASALINRVGLGNTTLALVADEIGLNLKSLRHYFARREDLMVEAFLQSIALHKELVSAAMEEATPERRVRSLVRRYFALLAQVVNRERPEFTYFSDLRALTEPHSLVVYQEYTHWFRAVRALLRSGMPTSDRATLNARTHMLVSQLLWSVAWIWNYVPEDFGRVADRLSDILLNGIATGHVGLQPTPAALLARRAPASNVLSQEAYLRAATILINEHGYRGASIERISAMLNVSRAAFYHHYEASDDLVVACFNRTFNLLRQAQSAAMSQEGSGISRAASAAVDLVTRQVTVEGLMLRTTALTVVGPELRQEMSRRMSLATFRFQDMLSDGAADGSVKICDLRIASEMMTATINSAAELGRWVPNIVPEQVSSLYVRPMLYGLFTAM